MDDKHHGVILSGVVPLACDAQDLFYFLFENSIIWHSNGRECTAVAYHPYIVQKILRVCF